MLKIAIDLDGTITPYPQIFSILTEKLSESEDIEIVILTSREHSSESYNQIVEELKLMRIYYHKIVITGNKQNYIQNNKINLFIDNQDENFMGLGPEICCLKVREEGNYDYDTHRWCYDNTTGKII